MIVGHSDEEESDPDNATEDSSAERPLINGDLEDLEDHHADGRVEEDQQEFHCPLLAARSYFGKQMPGAWTSE